MTALSLGVTDSFKVKRCLREELSLLQTKFYAVKNSKYWKLNTEQWSMYAMSTFKLKRRFEKKFCVH